MRASRSDLASLLERRSHQRDAVARKPPLLPLCLAEPPRDGVGEAVTLRGLVGEPSSVSASAGAAAAGAAVGVLVECESVATNGASPWRMAVQNGCEFIEWIAAALSGEEKEEAGSETFRRWPPVRPRAATASSAAVPTADDGARGSPATEGAPAASGLSTCQIGSRRRRVSGENTSGACE